MGRRPYERYYNHGGKDKKSHMLKHSNEKRHTNVCVENFRIAENGYSKNTPSSEKPL